MDHLIPWLRLQLTPGLGRAAQFRLINHFGSIENILDARPQEWPKLYRVRSGVADKIPPAQSPQVEQACEKLAQAEAWACTFWDDNYPALLRDIPDPPILLYGRGQQPQGKALAIVGARSPSSFGKRLTEQFAQELSESGLSIISGLARGIDSAAHRGALAGTGKTIAVLGCGIDVIYPPENDKLFAQIAEQGAILTEYPPGTGPLPGHFPGRNRIISGLSHGTLIVEATQNSGSLITAEFALEQGREVMAVPGNVGMATSYGPNHLIKQGAHPITEASDVQMLLKVPSVAKGLSQESDPAPTVKLAEPAASILKQLDLTPRHSDELAGESGLTPMELSAILLHLELQGYAEKLPGGHYISRLKASS